MPATRCGEISQCNDTYEPGSTFKIITMAAGLSQGVVHRDDRFSCPGFRVVEDREFTAIKEQDTGQKALWKGP